MDTKAAKRVLGACRYDPAAGRSYDILRGGFVWNDELPPYDSADHLAGIFILARVIAYRASLTLARPNSKYESEWTELRAALPSWPGFRQERIHGQVERDLRAAKLREDRCLVRFEGELAREEGPVTSLERARRACRVMLFNARSSFGQKVRRLLR